MFNIIHNEWVLKADFIIRKDEEYRNLEFGRRQRLRVGGRSVWVVSPEDLILSKLCWVKKSESELQRRDVEDIFAAIPDLDRSYLREWSEVLGVRSLLGEVERQ
jgi:hypothetical protein